MQRGCGLSVRAPQPSVRTRASRGAAGAHALPCPHRAAAGRRLRLACSAVVEPVPVMVNGITGKMGFATGEAAVQRGLLLLPVAFSGALRPRCPAFRLRN